MIQILSTLVDATKKLIKVLVVEILNNKGKFE